MVEGELAIKRDQAPRVLMRLMKPPRRRSPSMQTSILVWSRFATPLGFDKDPVRVMRRLRVRFKGVSFHLGYNDVNTRLRLFGAEG